MDKLSIKDLSFSGKKVLMRVDFNVPLKEGKITDDTRIVEALASIKYVIEHNGALILMSHLGKPKGQKKQDLSLAPCAKRLSKLLNYPIQMAPDCIGKETEGLVEKLKPKEILLLENLRFHEAEEFPEKDPSFAQKLASYADFYVNDAFGTCHRKHSSIYPITQFFPKKAATGFLLEKEIAYLGKYLKNPQRPFFAILGGAKISTKIGCIESLIDKVDELFIGGGMAYCFFKLQGKDIGDSLFEENQLPKVEKIIDKCLKKNVSLNLPLDLKIADSLKAEAQSKTISTNEDIPNGWQGVDIGPKTISIWTEKLKTAATIFWNGPLGVFEIKPFSEGTNKIAQALAASSAKTIVGGGDSIAAINALNLKNKFTHLSTGGGASLEYLEYGSLPGIEALSSK